MNQYVKEIVRKLCAEPETKFIETRRYVYYLHGVDDEGFAKIWRCNSYLFHRFSDTCYDRELVARVPAQHTYLKIYF